MNGTPTDRETEESRIMIAPAETNDRSRRDKKMIAPEECQSYVNPSAFKFPFYTHKKDNRDPEVGDLLYPHNTLQKETLVVPV